LRIKTAAVKDAFAESRDLAILVKWYQAAIAKLGDAEPNRV
jgi:hypothetical protein